METYYIILILFLVIVVKTSYEFYQLYKLSYFDEKCFSYKKIIVDKFNYNDYYQNNYYLQNQVHITNFMKNNIKCIFSKFNPNSHFVNNEIKSEVVFKCYC